MLKSQNWLLKSWNWKIMSRQLYALALLLFPSFACVFVSDKIYSRLQCYHSKHCNRLPFSTLSIVQLCGQYSRIRSVHHEFSWDLNFCGHWRPIDIEALPSIPSDMWMTAGWVLRDTNLQVFLLVVLASATLGKKTTTTQLATFLLQRWKTVSSATYFKS